MNKDAVPKDGGGGGDADRAGTMCCRAHLPCSSGGLFPPRARCTVMPSPRTSRGCRPRAAGGRGLVVPAAAPDGAPARDGDPPGRSKPASGRTWEQKAPDPLDGKGEAARAEPRLPLKLRCDLHPRQSPTYSPTRQLRLGKLLSKSILQVWATKIRYRRLGVRPRLS